jgi:hypothetical protein
MMHDVGIGKNGVHTRDLAVRFTRFFLKRGENLTQIFFRVHDYLFSCSQRIEIAFSPVSRSLIKQITAFYAFHFLLSLNGTQTS